MKKSLYVSAVAFVAMVFLCCPQKGLADLVTVHFLGKVTDIDPMPKTSTWEADKYFEVGDRFDGYYSYDLSSFEQGDPIKSGTRSKYGLEEINFSVGDVSGSADGGYLFVCDNFGNPPEDEYGFFVPRNIPLTIKGYSYMPISFGLALYDTTKTAFNTSALPLVVPDLRSFTSTSIDLLFGQGLSADGQYAATLWVKGEVTKLEQITPISTPVPASLLLLGSGLIGLVGRGLRRTKK